MVLLQLQRKSTSCEEARKQELKRERQPERGSGVRGTQGGGGVGIFGAAKNPRLATAMGTTAFLVLLGDIIIVINLPASEAFFFWGGGGAAVPFVPTMIQHELMMTTLQL